MALGAAIYTPELLISSAATGWLGILIATVPSPPVMESGTLSFFLRIIVSGPGQNFSASTSALSGTSLAKSYNALTSAICTISGLSEGLPLAAYILAEAFASSASAPSPYTVSVGKATSPPALRICPACSYIFLSSSVCVIFFIIVSIKPFASFHYFIFIIRYSIIPQYRASATFS